MIKLIKKCFGHWAGNCSLHLIEFESIGQWRFFQPFGIYNWLGIGSFQPICLVIWINWAMKIFRPFGITIDWIWINWAVKIFRPFGITIDWVGFGSFQPFGLFEKLNGNQLGNEVFSAIWNLQLMDLAVKFPATFEHVGIWLLVFDLGQQNFARRCVKKFVKAWMY